MDDELIVPDPVPELVREAVLDQEGVMTVAVAELVAVFVPVRDCVPAQG